MRALRIIGIVVGCIVAVLVAATIAIHLLVNPNDYKGRIEAAVKNSTGRELSLPGNISLSVFPWIAVKLGPASLGNPPGFPSSQPFASLQRASLRVRLLPLLLHRQLEVGRIEIDGLDLRLLKNARGRGNWQMPASPAGSTRSSSASSTSLGAIAGIIVKQSRVSYQDMAADQVSVDIGRVARGAQVPVSWNLDLATSPAAKPMHIAGRATLEYGANSAHLSGLDTRIDQSTLRGSAAVTNLTTGAMTFDLTLDHIDLDRYLPTTSPKAPAQSARPRTAPGAQPTELPTSALKTLQLNGKLAIGSAILHGIKLAQVAVGLAADEGLLRITPATAKLYGGDFAGNVTLDARGAVPTLALEEKLTGVAVQPLLVDFAKFNRLSGRGTVAMDLTARGHTTDAMLASLDGHAAMNLANGAVSGIDLWSTVNTVVALAQRHTLAGARTGGSTKFETFKASADFTNGVASTKDLSIASGDLRVTGQGTTNLVTGAIGYHLLATILKGPAAAGKQPGSLASIPLLVSGTMTSPSVRPDEQAMVKSLARRQLQKNKGAIENKLKGLLKGLIH